MKLQTLQILQIFIECRIMVGRRWCVGVGMCRCVCIVCVVWYVWCEGGGVCMCMCMCRVLCVCVESVCWCVCMLRVCSRCAFCVFVLWCAVPCRYVWCWCWCWRAMCDVWCLWCVVCVVCVWRGLARGKHPVCRFTTSPCVFLPFVPQRQIPMVLTFQQPMEFPQLQCVARWSMPLLRMACLTCPSLRNDSCSWFR